MSARSDRRNAEIEVIDAAIAWVNSNADSLAGDRLYRAVTAYCMFGLAEPSRTRTVMSAPETSHEAGEWMKQFALTDACAVFRQIYYVWRKLNRAYAANAESDQHEGLTCDEIEHLLDRTHQTMSPRVTELRDTGWIIDSGHRRKTRTGGTAIVWTPTQAALDLVDRAGLPIPVTNPRKGT